MKLAGFHYPMVIDAEGAVGAAAEVPIYYGHIEEQHSPSEAMECLVGQAPLECKDGKITAGGAVTGNSETVRAMLAHAAKGFKFQASVHGKPTEMTFVRDGETVTVNGRAVMGPVNVARKSVLDHVAILPLGADTTTSACIAAQNSEGDRQMEKWAWIKAQYGLDEAAFTALPKVGQDCISAEYDAAVADGGKKKVPAANGSEALIRPRTMRSRRTGRALRPSTRLTERRTSRPLRPRPSARTGPSRSRRTRSSRLSGTS